jgi:superfamily II DNA or RNA helicase
LKSLPRQIEQFSTKLTQQTKLITREDVAAYYQKSADHPTQLSSRRPDLLPHSGPRKPLDYQLDTITLAQRILSNNQSLLISLPTGAGKTFTCVNLLFTLFASGYRRIVWLAPQNVLLEQAEDELRKSWYTVAQPVGLKIADDEQQFKQFDFDDTAIVLFTTIQKAIRRNLDDLEPDLVIFDEAHYIEANEFGSQISRMRSSQTQLVGLTATPGRRSKSEIQHLVKLFDSNLITPPQLGDDPIAVLREKGVYSELTIQQLRPKSVSDIDRISSSQGLFLKPEQAALSAGRLAAIHELLDEEYSKRQWVVFCHSLGHTYCIATLIDKFHGDVGVVGSNLSDEKNLSVIEDFKAGKIRSIVNVKYAAVGADFPSADALLLTVPISSPIFFEQIVGRVARGVAVGGSEKSVVFDFDSHFETFEDVQSFSRFADAWR